MKFFFTYGSLQRGQSNHHILESVGAKYFDIAHLQAEKVPTKFPFPAIKEGLGLGVVSGEVYEVTEEALTHLDYFEGHPEFYQRRPAVTTEGLPVQVYFGTGVIDEQPQV